MPRQLEEITATFSCERMRFENANGDTIIGDATIQKEGGRSERIVVKGVAEDDEPSAHGAYRFYGSWATYRNKRTKQDEKQFHFKTFVRSTPHSRAGVVKYLEKAPNIGRVLAGRLFDRFKCDAVKILREQPNVAAAACDRLSLEGAYEAAAWLVVEQALEDCTIEIIDLLEGRGFRKSLAREVVKEFGNRAAQVIKKNPYILMRFRGCGFKLADALYLDLGGRPEALKRQAMCATHAVATATSATGDTWHYIGVAEQGLKGSVSGTDVRAAEAMRLADRGGIMCRVWSDGRDGAPAWDGDTQWVADARKARNEARLAKYIAEATSEPAWPITPDFLGGISVSEHQGINLGLATKSGAVGILGGSPGTGKTYTAAAYIKLLIDHFGHDCIAVAAPTGKAAVRISEAMAMYGIPIRARTIHSLLRVEKADSGGWSFTHGRDNPLPFRFIVLDEGSMVDTDLAASLFAARARGSYVLIVGDVNQLPPVGHGAPLRDMIAAGLPYGELTEIHRNDGGIVQACADMRDGKVFKCDGNLHHRPAGKPESQVESMLEILAGEIDPVWGCQVLVAVNKKSKLSRKDLNKTLQNQLNVNPIIDGTPFRLADKVVNTKNGYYPPANKDAIVSDEVATNEGGDIYVANGELGEVVLVEPKYLEVNLSSPSRMIRVPRGGGDKAEDDGEGGDEESSGTGCNWDLAYALSVHKSQGSEWPTVVVMVDDYPGAKKICDRAWIYTAISRAKKDCYLVGSKATADRFCRVNNIAKRKTFLTHLIQEEVRNL